MTQFRVFRMQQAETARLDAAIAKNLEELGYGGDWRRLRQAQPPESIYRCLSLSKAAATTGEH